MKEEKSQNSPDSPENQDRKMMTRRILTYVKPHWKRLLIAMICMILVALLQAAMAYMMKHIVDDIFMEKDAVMLRRLPFFVILLFALRGTFEFIHVYQMNFVGHTIVKNIRDTLYGHIQMLSLSFFNKNGTGVLMARILNDVGIVKETVSSAVTSLIKESFTVVFMLGLVFYQNWKLALIAIVVLPFCTIPVVKFGRLMRTFSTRCQECAAKVSTFLHETLTGARIVKAFCKERYEAERFCEKTTEWFGFEMKAVTIRALSSPVMALLGGFGIAFVLWYGGREVIQGHSTPGTFVSFITAVIMLYDPIRRLSPLNNTIQEGLAASTRVFQVMDTVSDIQDNPDAVTLTPGQHSVALKNVFFKYDEEMVLEDVTVEAKSGDILALVGMSGGGKTTLVNLIPRFYDVTGGAVLIDGQDIRGVTLSSLRGEIGIVTQDAILFNDTIRNNIAYGDLNASEEDVIDAAKAAYAYAFIRRFPDGFDTMVGEKGVRLSGGEKQRICIARALLKNAPILILDEATSSLDTESEKAVQKALENLMKGRTTFVIAHRLSTIRNADKIVVVVDGRIVEEGKHEELLAKKGAYHKLHDMQFETPPDGESLQVSGP